MSQHIESWTNNYFHDFEKYLLQSVKERNKTPFSTKEVLKILKNYNPPDDLDELSDETIVQVMKEEYKKRSRWICRRAACPQGFIETDF